MKTAFVLLIAVAAIGCSKSEVTADDMAKVRKDFSQENYEKAMIAAGKGAELEKEKAAAASRGDQ